MSTAEQNVNRIIAALAELEPWRRWQVWLSEDLSAYLFTTEDGLNGDDLQFTYAIEIAVLDTREGKSQTVLDEVACRGRAETIYDAQQRALTQLVASYEE